VAAEPIGGDPRQRFVLPGGEIDRVAHRSSSSTPAAIGDLHDEMTKLMIAPDNKVVQAGH
ncbi:hypothetical protein, partial [Mesorhizobium sp.]|uniref:hypothetical protein n=1 Tax=Mesorhizobium sp. TaxID=1871066 RepID=UPI0025F39365